MSLEDLGNIAELLAAVGVILSLIYLAVQIRQNTSNIDFNTDSGPGSQDCGVEEGAPISEPARGGRGFTGGIEGSR
jgi:hypothetical protein